MRDVLLIILTLFLMQFAAADVYKWKDEQGVTQYSNSPPPGKKAQQLEMAPSPSKEEVEQAQQRSKTEVEKAKQNPSLPTPADASEDRYECLSFIAVLPVMADAGMRALANDQRIYGKGGTAILVQKIAALSASGVSDATYSLGALYDRGYCVPRNPARAITLYNEAAADGNRWARERLGIK